ncbi:uncharacterized protein VTP21DRAFT_2873 [Calcarisporiella thermophila]|uniref:uncharacterized protein n=1 Tax=Calcarisporiella thermophila TaxID=911321 RepID=UPI003743B661
MARIAPSTTSVSAPESTRTFSKTAFRYYELPEAIILDHDPTNPPPRKKGDRVFLELGNGYLSEWRLKRLGIPTRLLEISFNSLASWALDLVDLSEALHTPMAVATVIGRAF